MKDFIIVGKHSYDVHHYMYDINYWRKDKVQEGAHLINFLNDL